MNNTPHPIFCRGHSGGRLLCELFIRNNIPMGEVSPEKKDTSFFSADNPQLRQIILNAYTYLTSTDDTKQHYQNIMRECVTTFYHAQIPEKSKIFGWKHGISLFSMIMLLEAFPRAKVIHLIRDGRDVMLSRLNARIENLADPLNRLAVFGDAAIQSFEGLPLNETTVANYRNALEIQHWVTAVEFGLQGRNYPKQYLEIKYEELCDHPIEIAQQIFNFLEVPFQDSAKTWLSQAVYQGRIGKWKELSATELELPLKIATPLLKKLGYL